MIDGKSYRFGAYKAQAKGNGKLAAGQEYFTSTVLKLWMLQQLEVLQLQLILIQLNWRLNYGCGQVQISSDKYKNIQIA